MIIPNIWKNKTCSKPPTSPTMDSPIESGHCFSIIRQRWASTKSSISWTSVTNSAQTACPGNGNIMASKCQRNNQISSRWVGTLEVTWRILNILNSSHLPPSHEFISLLTIWTAATIIIWCQDHPSELELNMTFLSVGYIWIYYTILYIYMCVCVCVCVAKQEKEKQTISKNNA